jgi:membrane protein DedA with SNARE-associated domain
LFSVFTTMMHHVGPWLGPSLGCAAFVGSLVIVGLSIPLTAILVSAGAVLGVRLLGPGVMPWIMAGAFLGSSTSYELGRYLKFRGVGPPRLPAKAQALTEALFVRHGALAIVVVRFTGPPTLASFIAGWSLLPRPRFMAANALASLSWPPIMVAVGYFGAQTVGFLR